MTHPPCISRFSKSPFTLLHLIMLNIYFCETDLANLFDDGPLLYSSEHSKSKTGNIIWRGSYFKVPTDLYLFL